MDVSLGITFSNENLAEYKSLAKYLKDQAYWDVREFAEERGRSSHWRMLGLKKKDLKKPEVKLALISLAIALVELGLQSVVICSETEKVIELRENKSIQIIIEKEVIANDDSITVQKLEKLKNDLDD